MWKDGITIPSINGQKYSTCSYYVRDSVTLHIGYAQIKGWARRFCPYLEDWLDGNEAEPAPPLFLVIRLTALEATALFFDKLVISSPVSVRRRT